MGLKSKMRSMNRGVYHRDNGKPIKFSGYENKKPILRKEDLLYFGGTEERINITALELKPLILTYAKNGIKKPAPLAKALNRLGKRTPSGDLWNPRLVYFLLHEMYKEKDKIKVIKKVSHTSELNRKNTFKLSDVEMKRRLLALKTHFE